MAKLRSYLDGLAIWTGAAPRPARARKINLALQGGGAHGAFSWGVADQLLADERIAIAGLSGTSAGALNAVMIADGLARGGRDEARRRLAEFWRAASTGGNLPAVQRACRPAVLVMPLPRRCTTGSGRCAISPYDLNPLNINPEGNWSSLSTSRGAREQAVAHIAATNVHPASRFFTRAHCRCGDGVGGVAVPVPAVEIGGRRTGRRRHNPRSSVPPHDEAEDVVVVQINPLRARQRRSRRRDRQPAERDH